MIGRRPSGGKPPTRESIYLGAARDAYVRGDLSLDGYEREVEHVLRDLAQFERAVDYVVRSEPLDS